MEQCGLRCQFVLCVLRQSLGVYFPCELIHLIVRRYYLLLPKLYRRRSDAILVVNGVIQRAIKWPTVSAQVSFRLDHIARRIDHIHQIGYDYDDRANAVFYLELDELRSPACHGSSGGGRSNRLSAYQQQFLW